MLNEKQRITTNQEIINKIQLNYNQIPVGVFLLGTNGSGKSSLRRYLDLSDIQSNIDPDMLNRAYKNKFPNTYTIESARKALSLYDDALKNGFNICLESTLAGFGTTNRIKNAKSQGYYTIAYYIGLNSVELNLKRIAKRVLDGGHDIPETSVRRRYVESSHNLVKLSQYFDEIHIIDNSSDIFSLQYSIVNKNSTTYEIEKETWARNLFEKISKE